LSSSTETAATATRSSASAATCTSSVPPGSAAECESRLHRLVITTRQDLGF
jgi:hypothetical protein